MVDMDTTNSRYLNYQKQITMIKKNWCGDFWDGRDENLQIDLMGPNTSFKGLTKWYLSSTLDLVLFISCFKASTCYIYDYIGEWLLSLDILDNVNIRQVNTISLKAQLLCIHDLIFFLI